MLRNRGLDELNDGVSRRSGIPAGEHLGPSHRFPLSGSRFAALTLTRSQPPASPETDEMWSGGWPRSPTGLAPDARAPTAVVLAWRVRTPNRSPSGRRQTPGARAWLAIGSLLAVLVGLSRIYLRAHYASDVIAGEALAVAMYGLAATSVITRQARRDSAVNAEPPSSAPTSVV